MHILLCFYFLRVLFISISVVFYAGIFNFRIYNVAVFASGCQPTAQRSKYPLLLSIENNVPEKPLVLYQTSRTRCTLFTPACLCTVTSSLKMC